MSPAATEDGGRNGDDGSRDRGPSRRTSDGHGALGPELRLLQGLGAGSSKCRLRHAEGGDRRSRRSEPYSEIPLGLFACHTAEISGYPVEGHVPESVVRRLLSERPNLRGLAMPACPSDRRGWREKAAALRGHSVRGRGPKAVQALPRSAGDRLSRCDWRSVTTARAVPAEDTAGLFGWRSRMP